MRLHSIAVSDIVISTNRQRREITPEKLLELAGSIEKNGLICPVVVRKDADDNIVLIAGERRIRAMMYIWDIFNGAVRCGEYAFESGHVPCIWQGEMDPLDAFEMELEENVRRVDLTWQERATATKQLIDLRRAQAARDGSAIPTLESIHEEIHGTTSNVVSTRDQIAVATHLGDPDVAKAGSAKEAFKILKRKEQTAKNAALAIEVGRTLTQASHDLHHGECLEVLADFPPETFDVILTDPPYGIDADQFSDSGGRVSGAHFYDDSWSTWNKLITVLSPELFRLAKPQAHSYIFCDIDNFVILKQHLQTAGWRVFRTPLIWVNPTAMRTPWPEHGPQRKYQICLFAVKGDRPVNRIYSDVLTHTSDDNLGHQAQKPVALYQDLLARSIRPGDSVLDPFGGTGPILSAAHELKCRATYIEQDAAAYGIAVKRLQELV